MLDTNKALQLIMFLYCWYMRGKLNCKCWPDLEFPRKSPLTAPIADRATDIGIIHIALPIVRLANVCNKYIVDAGSSVTSGVQCYKWGAVSQVGCSITSGVQYHKWGAVSQVGCSITSGVQYHKWGAVSQVGCSITSGVQYHKWGAVSQVGCSVTSGVQYHKWGAMICHDIFCSAC